MHSKVWLSFYSFILVSYRLYGKDLRLFLMCKIMWGRFKPHNLYPDKHAAMMKMNVDME